METIKTLDNLSYNLSLGPGIEGYNTMIASVDLPDEELNKVTHWDDERYQRVSIYDTPGLEALITCFKPKQAGPIHDYSYQQGWVKVLRGQLKLEYYHSDNDHLKAYNSLVFKKGEVVYLNDNLGFHRFSNPGPGPTVALHFYSDKILRWHIYDEGTGVISEQDTSCDRYIEV